MNTPPSRFTKSTVVAVWFVAVFVTACSQEPAGSLADRERDACFANMLTIHEAIQAHRKAHKDLPNWLSDLTPQYLPDDTVFQCPVTRRTGARNVFGLEDPEIVSSYIYEFCNKEVPGTIFGGSPLTMKRWKQMTMALVGGRVPILRCHQHEPRLNVSFDGDPFESSVTWEFDPDVADYVDRAALSPDALAREFGISAAPPASPRRAPIAAPTAGRPERLVNPSRSNPLVGKPAPDFTLDLLEGGEFQLSKQRGRHIVVLDFWATWCGPCLNAMPTLIEVTADFADQGVQYVAVDLREDPGKIKRFLKAQGWDISVPLDRDGGVAKQYGVRGIPTMVIVDKAGIVRALHVGASPNLETRLREELQRVVDG